MRSYLWDVQLGTAVSPNTVSGIHVLPLVLKGILHKTKAFGFCVALCVGRDGVVSGALPHGSHCGQLSITAAGVGFSQTG